MIDLAVLCATMDEDNSGSLSLEEMPLCCRVLGVFVLFHFIAGSRGSHWDLFMRCLGFLGRKRTPDMH